MMKIINKVAAIVLGISSLSMAGTVAIDEGFEGLSGGTTLPDGWVRTGDAAWITNAIASSGTNSLVVQDRSNSQSYLPQIAKAAHMEFEDTLFRFDFMLESGATDEEFTVRLDDGSSQYIFLRLRLVAGEKIQASSSGDTMVDIADVVRDEWNSVEVTIGTEWYQPENKYVYSSNYTIKIINSAGTYEETLGMNRNKKTIERLIILGEGTANDELMYMDNVYLGDPALLVIPPKGTLIVIR